MFFLHLCLRAMAGVAGFEPAHGGIKSRCLTAWPHPKLIFGVFYSIICIKGERSKLFTKTNSGFLLRTSLAWSSLSNSINMVEPVPDSRGFPIDSNLLNKELILVYLFLTHFSKLLNESSS